MTGGNTFRDLLRTSAAETGSIACMGLDPILEGLPSPELSISSRVLFFFKLIFERMLHEKVLPGAFKPNIGFFHSLDDPMEGRYEGSRSLREIVILIRELFPGIPVILDMKRGDIARSSANYAAEAFKVWKADAVTVSPYMGSDSVGPFIELASGMGRGVYILNRTSNPGGQELQNLSMADGQPLYKHVAKQIISWGVDASAGTAGAVVGATNPQELFELARLYKEGNGTEDPAEKNIAPLLIPGVGGQGGSASQTVGILKSAGYPLELARVNSSSGLTHPWVKKGSPLPEDFAVQVVKNLKKMNQELNYAE